MLTDLAGWRSIFIINAPVGALAAVAATRAVRADQGAGARRAPDIAGAVLITAAMALAVWAPAQGSDRGWTSAAFLVPIAAAVILAAAFVINESRRSDPLIRLAMLRSGWMAGTSVATAVTGALNGVVVLLCTLFLQHVHGYSPLRAGLAFVPTGLAGLAAGTRLAGPLITRFGVRAVLTVSLLASAAGVAGLSLLQGGGSYLPLLPWLVVIGAAFTTAAVATTIAVSAGVATGEQGMAAAIRQTAFQLGVALSVAILLSVAASYTATRLTGPHPQSTVSALTEGYRLALAITRRASCRWRGSRRHRTATACPRRSRSGHWWTWLTSSAATSPTSATRALIVRSCSARCYARSVSPGCWTWWSSRMFTGPTTPPTGTGARGFSARRALPVS